MKCLPLNFYDYVNNSKMKQKRWNQSYKLFYIVKYNDFKKDLRTMSLMFFDQMTVGVLLTEMISESAC
ncbi:unnamed protein product [Rotaria magnacalcarata]